MRWMLKSSLTPNPLPVMSFLSKFLARHVSNPSADNKKRDWG